MEKKITLVGQVGNFFVKELSKCLDKEGFSIEVLDHPRDLRKQIETSFQQTGLHSA